MSCDGRCGFEKALPRRQIWLYGPTWWHRQVYVSAFISILYWFIAACQKTRMKVSQIISKISRFKVTCQRCYCLSIILKKLKILQGHWQVSFDALKSSLLHVDKNTSISSCCSDLWCQTRRAGADVSERNMFQDQVLLSLKATGTNYFIDAAGKTSSQLHTAAVCPLALMEQKATRKNTTLE